MEIQYRSQLVFLMKSLNLPLIAAELGVAEGLFSRDLLQAGLEKLYSVDNWGRIDGQSGDGGYEDQWHDNNYNNVIKLLKPFGKKSIILRGLSVDMAAQVPDNSLGLCYVDCFHTYDGVTKDCEAWYGKVVLGGIMAFHDYENPSYGVKQAVKYFCDKKGITEIHSLPENNIEDAGGYFFKI